jgi:hypothetical protein
MKILWEGFALPNYSVCFAKFGYFCLNTVYGIFAGKSFLKTERKGHLGKRQASLIILLCAAILILTNGCHRGQAGPGEVLDRYLSSAVKQDYAKVYDCYYADYKAKVSKEEYIKHRKEASVLQSYKIISLKQEGDTAQAEVRLTFAPSVKLQRKEPVDATVKEDLIREAGEWKIKVW